MGIELTVKINNESVVSYNTLLRITNSFPTLTWVFNQLNRVVIDEYTGVTSEEEDYTQAGYEIRISTSSINIGSDLFIGNRSSTGYLSSQERFWSYEGIPLERGLRYYGQLRVRDEADRQSDWETFSFLYNSLPLVSNLLISPSIPSVSDNLVLSYDFSDSNEDTESGTTIRWFKNGIHQRQFNNSITIASQYMQYNDVWLADVYPSDGYEYGHRVSSYSIMVKKPSVTVSNVRVLPSSPNENDVLKADYIASDELEQENVSIRWFINDNLQTQYNEKQFIRPTIEEGDTVRIEVKPDSGNQYVASSSVTVIASNFIVTDLTIDGRIEPLDVSSVTPSVKWKTYVPYGKQINYVHIKMGTFYEADNEYSQIFNFNRETFTIPTSTLQRGRDYYLSVSVSDTQVFDRYTSTHFRTIGSRWEENVNNSIGWTLEALFVIGDGYKDKVGYKDYQILRINDGSRFAEIQIRNNKVSLISGDTKEVVINSNEDIVLTVAGQGDNIKIYLNRVLSIDGSGIFTQKSSTKRLELGSSTDSGFEVWYKYLSYTTAGYYLPGVSSEYSNLQFHTLISFVDNEVVALNTYKQGRKIFGLNPDNTNESSTIYSLGPGDVYKNSTVVRTFSPINKIKTSPDGKNIVCAHEAGVTIINNYVIDVYSNNLTFVTNGTQNNISPENNGWEVVQNVGFIAGYNNADGFNIDTTNDSL